ncbi:hypothetical protein LINGRAHAP2_LOCUS29795 [Linum grandiflorum]
MPSFHLANLSEGFLPFQYSFGIMLQTMLFKCFLVRTRIWMSHTSRIHQIENREDYVLSLCSSSVLPTIHHLSQLLQTPFARSIVLC